jgi:hypothetical protein
VSGVTDLETLKERHGIADRLLTVNRFSETIQLSQVNRYTHLHCISITNTLSP